MNPGRGASQVEVGAIRRARRTYDVAILGGGLAGLTLAIQLKRARPQTDVVVLEKREGPAPEAAFKVGESTVPSGAHYFAEIVGMRDHLELEQLIKCGLRFFSPAGDNADITRRLEYGPPLYPPHDNYQIDRGRFENELATRAREQGVDLLQGARVGDVELGGERHAVAFTELGREGSLEARWVVDATGRASLLERKLDLSEEIPHTINASWLRLAGGLDLEQWGAADEAWMGRMTEPGIRQFSTNHLLGEGYWVWLIALSSGAISIGLCADPRWHAWEEMNELDRLMSWFDSHEPQLAASLRPRLDDVQDFLRVQDFAYGVQRVLSPERWCLVGEAGAFADPFYSPGSDFIGYSNSFSCDVIRRDLDGEEVAERIEWFNSFYLRTFRKTIAFYTDQYQIFGNPQVTTVKLAWDGFLNHWAPTLLMAQNRIADLEFMRSVDEDVERGYRLNERVQEVLRAWHRAENPPLEGKMTAAALVKPFLEVLVGMTQEYDEEALRAACAHHADSAEGFAVQIFHRAARALGHELDESTPVDPYAVGPDPERWERDGVFARGLTLEQARARAEGVETLWT